jgi:ribosomal protein S18 acetylase RimI-like enzyme
MEIRRAETRDIPGMIELLYQVGEVHHVIRPDIFRAGALKYTSEMLAELLRDENKPVFVAVRGSFVAGYCFCVHKQFRDHETFTDRTEFYIDDLCVDEACRGQGIATALFDHAVHYARQLQVNAITLNVWCGNDSAMKFYEKVGLKPRNVLMEMKLC